MKWPHAAPFSICRDAARVAFEKEKLAATLSKLAGKRVVI
jgi:hypothetical protein